MALLKCPECDAMVSSKARHCVGCGYPINDEPAPAEAPPIPQAAVPAAYAPAAAAPDYEPLPRPCSACGTEVKHRREYRRRPTMLLMAFLFLVVGGVIMNMSDSESHKTIAAFAFTGLALWAVISAFRRQDADVCPACGEHEFVTRWHEL